LAGVTDQPDDRSSIAVAYTWASRIIGVSLEMVIPGLIGVWLDGNDRLGTRVVFTILGFAVGMVLGLWHLIRMTTPTGRGHGEEGNSGERSER
jgi:hypothetical protein